MKSSFLLQFSMNYLCFLNTIGPPFFFIYSFISVFFVLCLLQRTTTTTQLQQQQKSFFMTILSRGKSLIQPSSTPTTHKLQQYDDNMNQTMKQKKNKTSLSYMYDTSWMMVPKSWFIYYYIIAWINFALLQASWIIVLNKFRILKKNQITMSSTFDQSNRNLYHDHTNHHQSTEYFHQVMQTPNHNDIKMNQYEDYDTVSLCNIVILFLYGVHISRRLYENLFIHCHSKSRMNVLVLIGGILFYIFIPSSLLSLPYTCFNIDVDDINNFDGLINNRYRDTNNIQKHNNGTSKTSFSYYYLISLWVISMLNIVFQFEQYHHHVILSNLRKRHQITNSNRHQNTNNAHHHTNDYPIPMGGLFHYVSCPHYFFEILIYSTFGMLLFLDQYGIDKPNAVEIMQLHRNRIMDNRMLSSLYDVSSTTFGIILSFIFQYRFFMAFTFIVSNLIYTAAEYHYWYQNAYGMQYRCLNRNCIIPGII